MNGLRAGLPLLFVLLALPPAPRAGEPPRGEKGSSLNALLARHVGYSMLKQLALEDVIGESKGWHVSISEGVLWFDDGERHPVQLLGTQADEDGTWLWAWANEQSHLPPAITRASERLRALGAEKGWKPFTTRKLEPPASDGHTVALVACGLLGGAAYYRGPYEGGAAYFLFTDFPRAEQVNVRPERLQRAILTSISTFDVDHREVVRGLAADLHLKLVERPDRLVLTAGNGNELHFELDPQGRITKISGTLTK